ncbi:MAG TPA: chromate transporter [Rhodocyclaceae bacterium]
MATTEPPLTPPPAVATAAAVSLGQLFRGFCLIGLSGFGGVLPWARRYLVERYRWLAPEEFAALLGLCQIMPGPNVMNLAVVVGARFQGRRGAVVAPLGMMLAPLVIVLGLGLLYLRYGELAALQALLRGVSAVGAGLILATGLKMGFELRRWRPGLPLALLTCVAVAGLRLPLPAVVAVLLPLGMAIARRGRR